jgi:beta-aspartyl-peptidase (threonine type)
MEYKNMSLNDAMQLVVNEKLVAMNGQGGMIGVDAQGNAALVFNSAGMYRGIRNNRGLNNVSIYR